MFSPENSRHFTRHINPGTNMEYYVLTTRVAPVQQGFYFVNSGFSADGRYLWFYCAYPPRAERSLGVVDFLTDEVYAIHDATAWGTWVDPQTGNAWFGTFDGIYMRTPHPNDRARLIFPFPEYIKKATVTNCATHLSVTQDRKEMMVDVQTLKGSYIGTFHMVTGEFTEWYHTEPGIPFNHAHLCPDDPNLCLCAHEYTTDPDKGDVPPALINGIYPRLRLVGRDGSCEMRTPYGNYATHEWWAEDGKSIYYCSGQQSVVHDRLGENEPEVICHIPIEGGNGTWHSFCTKDEKYFVVDGSHPSLGLTWWRGCPSTVRFWNNETKKLIDLVSYNPVVEGWSPSDPCPYHIDPHPRFVLGDTMILFTTTVRGYVDVAVAPVQQLIDATK